MAREHHEFWSTSPHSARDICYCFLAAQVIILLTWEWRTVFGLPKLMPEPERLFTKLFFKLKTGFSSWESRSSPSEWPRERGQLTSILARAAHFLRFCGLFLFTLITFVSIKASRPGRVRKVAQEGVFLHSGSALESAPSFI